MANVSTEKVQRTLEALGASFGASRTPPGPSAQGPDKGQGPRESQGHGQGQGPSNSQAQGEGQGQALVPGGSQGGTPVKLPSSLHSSSKLERSQPEASDPNATKDKDGHLLHLELLCMPSMTPVNMVRGGGMHKGGRVDKFAGGSCPCYAASDACLRFRGLLPACILVLDQVASMLHSVRCHWHTFPAPRLCPNGP